MGLNTCHNRALDSLVAKNITNDTKFNCTKLSPVEAKKIYQASGHDYTKLKLTIKVNGNCNVNINDSIEIMNQRYSVLGIDNNINPMLTRYRKDFNSMQGSKVIYLE